MPSALFCESERLMAGCQWVRRRISNTASRVVACWLAQRTGLWLCARCKSGRVRCQDDGWSGSRCVIAQVRDCSVAQAIARGCTQCVCEREFRDFGVGGKCTLSSEIRAASTRMPARPLPDMSSIEGQRGVDAQQQRWLRPAETSDTDSMA